jgi:hypothetical protein
MGDLSGPPIGHAPLAVIEEIAAIIASVRGAMVQRELRVFRLDRSIDEPSLSRSFDALDPLLWAGARSARPTKSGATRGFGRVPDAGYALVFDEAPTEARPNLLVSGRVAIAIRHRRYVTPVMGVFQCAANWASQ